MAGTLPRGPAEQRLPAPRVADDEVVDEGDADDLGGGLHAAGEGHVLGRGRGVAARVGVEEHHAGGAAEEALLQDLARLDGGAVEGAAVELAVAEEAVPRIQ